MNNPVHYLKIRILSRRDNVFGFRASDMDLCELEIYGSIFKYREFTYEKPIMTEPVLWDSQDEEIVEWEAPSIETETKYERTVEVKDYNEMCSIIGSLLDAKNQNLPDGVHRMIALCITDNIIIKKLDD